MNSMDDVLRDSLERFLKSHCTPHDVRRHERGASTTPLWQSLEEHGYPNGMLGEEAGGAALGLSDIRAVTVLLGQYLLPVPLAETMFARTLLSNAGVDSPAGPMILLGESHGENGRADAAVLFGLVAQHALIECVDGLNLVSLAGAEVTSTGVRGSQSAHIRWHRDRRPIATLSKPEIPLVAINAMLRAALMVGAMQRLLSMTLDYANTREQFGRSIGKFQVIQQQIAEMAEQLLSAEMAVQMAFAGSHFPTRPLLSGLAKQRSSAAASVVAATAHAVHGAVGLSEECDLQLYVRRLYEWRLADGSEAYWAEQLGDHYARTLDGTLQFIRGHLFGDDQVA